MAKSRRPRGATRPLPAVRTRRPSGRGAVRTIGVRFPTAYMKIIEQEGARLGVSRGQFLTMLVKRAEGNVVMERPPNAPAYEVTEKELKDTQLYVWQVLHDVRERIDAERLRMGNIAVAAYLIHLVNHWLGQPMGLRLKG